MAHSGGDGNDFGLAVWVKFVTHHWRIVQMEGAVGTDQK